MERKRARTIILQEIRKPGSFADWIEHREGFELLLSLIPDMAALKETAQNWYHRDDVWTHSLMVLKGVEQLHDEAFLPFEGHAQFLSHLFQETLDEHLTRYGALRLTALLHDIGKPEAQECQEGRITFIEHERIGSEKMETIGQALGLTEKEQDYMKKLIRYHLRPLLLSDLEEISPRALNRLSRALGDYLPDLAVLSWADVEATCGTQSSEVKTQRHHHFALSLLQRCRSGILDSSENRCNNGAEKRAENS
ncbi:MAG: HDIG domain-containing metalloprotein [Candidatus Xenobiia bacterium LiM19]